MPGRTSNVPAPPWGNNLVLFRYFLRLFGKESLSALARELNDVEHEGVTEGNNTKFWFYLDSILAIQGAEAKISRDTLKSYDENIVRYVGSIGYGREGGIKLKYFQYMACLFTEMYLDKYFTDASAFANELNRHVDIARNESLGQIDIEPFTPENMNKLAFMCATGSGKTLIMHINIMQFKHYIKKKQALKPDTKSNKIIVLAPNEGMSEQHLDELELSNISAKPFMKNAFVDNADIIVIDMNKLKEEGKVKTVSVDSFEGNNLVLVDEAHRGLAGDVWYDYRSRLSADVDKGGFAFEYSATLKQAMRSGKPSNTNNEQWKSRLDEYYRAIIIDYSYKYFYDDGYGKEYRIYNLRDNIIEEQRQLYLTGCLMSFYQQLKLYTERSSDFTMFHIEKPLLVFVGNRVTAKTSKDEMTDVEEVIEFIDRFVKDKESTIKRIHSVLNDDTGLLDGNGKELFWGNFSALDTMFGGTPDADVVYSDILRILFNSESTSDALRLHVINLRRVGSEIALRIGTDGEYFGVISIGDTAGLMKLLDAKSIVTAHDEFLDESLFSVINEKKSQINILVGSRKFTEGWNSWRVSTMGLINFAKGEGSQAIQLFGRGVRLRGYGRFLKRSRKLDISGITPPPHIELLETLTIFGIKAQYMEDFKKYLELEGVPVNPNKYTLTVRSRYDSDKHSGLRVIRLKKDANFKKQAARLLLNVPDEGFASYLARSRVVIDCRSKIQSIESTSSMQIDSDMAGIPLDERFIPWLDYERIANELEQYKNEKFYYNISISKPLLKDIMEFEGWYLLIAPENQLAITSATRLQLATDFAIMALKGYIDRFFKYERNKWEAPLREYSELECDDANFVEEYTISYMSESDDDRGIEEVERFVDELQALLDRNNGTLTEPLSKFGGALVAFDFGAHLYTPLIFLEAGRLQLSVSPVGLNKGEKSFVEKLSEYVRNHTDVLNGKDLYLLRNKSKVGTGFFEAAGFYPDFILWIDAPEVQYITFVDPKGLRNVSWESAKIEFYETIKAIETRLQPTYTEKTVILNSFIMSDTPSSDLYELWRKDCADRRAKNIYCLDEEDCIEGMIGKILR